MQLKSMIRLLILSLGPLLLALALTGLPAPTPAQAMEHFPLPETWLQSRAVFTVYLPIIQRSPPSPPASELTPAEQLLALINAERQRRGLNPLIMNIILMQAAEAHSQDMIDRNFFSHTNPDGLGPGDRLTNAGYNWRTWGENIGAGYLSAEAMFNGWMDSGSHQDIMLNPNFTEIGIGYVTGGYYGHYWTADFGDQ